MSTSETHPLVSALTRRTDALEGVSAAARAGKKEQFAGALARLIGDVATDLPIVGKLLEASAREAFASSSYGRVEALLAELEAEQEEAARQERLAGLLAELIGQRLATSRENMMALQRATLQQTLLIDASLKDLRATVDALQVGAVGAPRADDLPPAPPEVPRPPNRAPSIRR